MLVIPVNKKYHKNLKSPKNSHGKNECFYFCFIYKYSKWNNGVEVLNVEYSKNVGSS